MLVLLATGEWYWASAVSWWLALAVILYTWGGYPLFVWFIRHVMRRPSVVPAPYSGGVSIVIAAHNESANIERRLTEMQALLSRCSRFGQIILVSDGSTDATGEVARRVEGVDVIELTDHGGKASALNTGCAAAVHEVIVFADARQRWEPDTIERLLDSFSDPGVGGASGELVLESPHDALVGVGLYWRFEKWLRQQESAVHSTIGVTGAVAAVRRSLFVHIPSGTILDDVYWPLHVVRQGFRVIHEARAIAHDRLPARMKDEFNRKVRTQAGVLQLCALAPWLLVPGVNPVWWEFVSHKVMRLLVPWCALFILLGSWHLDGVEYRVIGSTTAATCGLGLLGLNRSIAGRARLCAPAASLLVLHAAAWMGFWTWLFGRTDRAWKKAKYG